MPVSDPRQLCLHGTTVEAISTFHHTHAHVCSSSLAGGTGRGLHRILPLANDYAIVGASCSPLPSPADLLHSQIWSFSQKYSVWQSMSVLKPTLKHTVEGLKPKLSGAENVVAGVSCYCYITHRTLHAHLQLQHATRSVSVLQYRSLFPSRKEKSRGERTNYGTRTDKGIWKFQPKLKALGNISLKINRQNTLNAKSVELNSQSTLNCDTPEPLDLHIPKSSSQIRLMLICHLTGLSRRCGG